MGYCSCTSQCCASADGTVPDDSSLAVPTEPATTQTTAFVLTNAHLPQKRKHTGVSLARFGNVPIITLPPPLPLPPAETPAVVRVRRYLERERG
ncbi:hypothetical protein DXG01_009004 [Tephrocybe rancida]|nr:hypothetical protein DXG01_009004 [Tephrocybe rancida]